MRAVVAESLIAEALINSGRVTRVYTVEAGLAVVFIVCTALSAKVFRWE